MDLTVHNTSGPGGPWGPWNPALLVATFYEPDIQKLLSYPLT